MLEKTLIINLLAFSLFYNNAIAQNIIENGGFEDGQGEWSSYFDSNYSGSLNIISNNAHSGTKAAKMEISSIPSSPIVYHAQLKNNTFYLDSGHAYHITLWMKASQTMDVQLIMSQNNSPWAWLDAKTVTLSTSYEMYDLYISSSPYSTKDGVRFAVRCGNAVGSVYVDDVVITDCTKENNEHSLQVAMYGEGTINISGDMGKSQFLESSTQNYADGELITLEYEVEPGYSFNGWSGACSGYGPCSITMDQSKFVSATFNKLSSPDECIDYKNRVDWSIAGYKGVIPSDGNIIDMTAAPYNCVGNGTYNNFNALENALDDMKSHSGLNILYFPPGTYYFRDHKSLIIPDSTIIRGACASSTIFNIEAIDTMLINGTDTTKYTGNHFFRMEKTGGSAGKYGDTISVLGGYTIGSNILSIETTSDIAEGDFVQLWQANDSTKMLTDSDWDDAFHGYAKNAVGEIARVVQKKGNQIMLDRSLHLSYTPHLKPKIRRIGLANNIGIENLKIHRIDNKDNYNISIDRSYNCWVRNIESSYTMKAHVWIRRSYHIEVRESYFHHSYDYGGGGHGYGVVKSVHSSSCLTEFNVFNTLRHAMILSVGSNGNVYGYNYSRVSYDPSGNNGLGDQKADISIHGFYPFMNLFEGNIVEFMHSSDHWGPSGPGNTFFRNRASEKPMSVWDYSHYQNIIGNELTNFIVGSNFDIESSCLNTNRHSNNDRGNIDIDKIHTLPPSLYNSSANFNQGFAYPNIGPMPGFNNTPYPIEQHINKAKYRYQWNTPAPCISSCPDPSLSEKIDTCSSPISISTYTPNTSTSLYGITITNIPGTYNNFEPLEGDPELYYIIKLGSTTIYTSPVAPSSLPDVYITADFLDLSGSNLYTIEVYEDDVSNDDYLGSVSFNSNSSSSSFSNSVTGGTLSIELDKVSTETKYLWSNGDSSSTSSFDSSGIYSITITDFNGCKSFDEILININDPINIIKDNASFQIICQGGQVDTLSFEVNGGSGIKYQWYEISDSVNGQRTPVIGANNSSFIPSSLNSGTNYYYCVAEDTLNPDCGKDSSSFSKLIVNEGMYISSQPISEQEVCEGGVLNDLSLSVSNGIGLQYQWYQYSTQNSSATAISGANYYLLPMNSSITPDTYFYYCEITSSGSGCNIVISDTAKVIIRPDLDISNTNLADQMFCFGDSASSMSVIVSGGVTPMYQWYESSTTQAYAGMPISNATDSIYTPSSNNVGEKYYYCSISDSNSGCSTYTYVSNIATIDIEESVYITNQSQQNNSFCQGYGTVNLSVTSNNSSNTQYQWYQSSLNYYTGTAINLATSNNYNAPLGSWSSKFYYCVVSNSSLPNCGQDSSHIFRVTGLGQPTITQNPISTQSICEGNSISSLSASAIGGVTPQYQWYINSNSSFSGATPISGANSLNYTPTDSSPGNYYYFFVISDSNTSCYSDTSSYSHLGIYEKPKITKEPIPFQKTCLGQTPDTISFEAWGGTGWGLEWFINSDSSYIGAQPAPNAFSPDFIPPDTLSIGSHYYYCVFSDVGFSQCGSDTTIISHVKVIDKPVTDFIFYDSSGTVSFTDQSQNATSWDWVFGDGDSSNTQNPNHYYDSSGTFNATLISSNQCGADSTSKLIVIIATDIDEINSMLDIYPNPTEGVCMLKLNKNQLEHGKLLIYDITGKLVYASKTNTIDQQLDLGFLSKGQYKVVYESEKMQVTKSIVIQ